MKKTNRGLENRYYCHHCDDLVTIGINEEYQKNNIRGTVVETLVRCPTCTKCGSEIYIPQINDENLDRINDNFREITGRIFVSEIEEILNMYNIGAKPLSLLLGWGECTIIRYLKGQIPNKENSEKLRSLKNPVVFLEIYNGNKDVLSGVASKKVIDALTKYVNISQTDENSIAEKGLIDYFSGKPDVYSGYSNFNLKKLINFILFFVNKYGGIYKTKMNKLLWYSDMLFYKKYGTSITGLKYRHINYGPVPVRYDWIYGSLSEVYFVLEENDYGTKIEPIRTCEESVFTENELEVIRCVGEKFGFWYAGDLSSYSHKEKAYINTKRGEIISYNYARELSLDLPVTGTHQ